MSTLEDTWSHLLSSPIDPSDDDNDNNDAGEGEEEEEEEYEKELADLLLLSQSGAGAGAGAAGGGGDGMDELERMVAMQGQKDGDDNEEEDDNKEDELARELNAHTTPYINQDTQQSNVKNTASSKSPPKPTQQILQEPLHKQELYTLSDELLHERDPTILATVIRDLKVQAAIRSKQTQFREQARSYLAASKILEANLQKIVEEEAKTQAVEKVLSSSTDKLHNTSTSSLNVAVDNTRLTELLRKYKLAALTAKKSNDTTTARRCLEMVRSIQTQIDSPKKNFEVPSDPPAPKAPVVKPPPIAAPVPTSIITDSPNVSIKIDSIADAKESVWVVWDLGYEDKKGNTETTKGGTLNYEHSFKAPTAKSWARFVERKKISFEVWTNRGFFRGKVMLGKAVAELVVGQSSGTLQILDGRKPTGMTMDYSLYIPPPLGRSPSSSPLTKVGRTPSMNLKSNLAPVDSAYVKELIANFEDPEQMGSSLVVQNEIDRIDKFLLEAKMRSSPVPDTYAAQRTALDLRLQLMVTLVQSGALDMNGYIDQVKESIAATKQLALDFKKEKKMDYAFRAMERIKTMQGEVAEVEEAIAAGTMDF